MHMAVNGFLSPTRLPGCHPSHHHVPMSWPLQHPDKTPTAASCPEQAAILHPRGGVGVVVVVGRANVPGGMYTYNVHVRTSQSGMPVCLAVPSIVLVLRVSTRGAPPSLSLSLSLLSLLSLVY